MTVQVFSATRHITSRAVRRIIGRGALAAMVAGLSAISVSAQAPIWRLAIPARLPLHPGRHQRFAGQPQRARSVPRTLSGIGLCGAPRWLTNSMTS